MAANRGGAVGALGAWLRVAFVAAMTVMMTTPRPALADVRTEARGHFRTGMALIQRGKLDEGVSELEAAYDLLPHPNVLYNIARAYAEAGRYEAAIEYYERYLDSDPPDREEVNLFIQALEQRMAETRRSEEPAEETPDVVEEPTGLGASEEEIQALEDSATQIATLAEATQSEALRQRAERLRALAAALREGGMETAPSETEAPAPTPGEPSEPTPTEAGEEGVADLSLGQVKEEDVYAESVVSASRYAQSPLDAPNSTETITRQDIRLSGLTNIYELLRRVAGMDVMTLWPGDTQIGLRGFNNRLANKVLVLIDGRSINRDFIGPALPSREPFSVEDIESIEVVRGPASALYGANAFSGVVNILTRPPGKKSTNVTLGAGNRNTYHAHTATSGRAKGRLGYRLSASYDTTDRYEYAYDPAREDLVKHDNTSLGYRAVRANGSLRYRFHRDVQGTFQAGISDAFAPYETRGPNLDYVADGETSHVMGLVETSWGQLRAFWNRGTETTQNASGYLNSDVNSSRLIYNILDVDATISQEFHLLVDHNFHVGGNYRRKEISWTFFPRDYDENHYAFYAQDTMTLASWLLLNGSIRMDRHPLLDGPVWSPRGAVILKPAKGNAIRLSAGTAFRTPTFVETYQDITLQAAPGIAVRARGSEIAEDPLEPESILSAEIGYINNQSDKLKFELNGYYNRVNDIMFATGDGVSLASRANPGTRYSPEANAYVVGQGTTATFDGAYNVYGGETQVRLYLVKGLDYYVNYAYNFTDLPDNRTAPFPDGVPDSKRTAAHKINTGVQYRSEFGLDLALDLHWTDETEWLLSDRAARTTFTVVNPAYYLINARVGYRLFDDMLELAVTGYNVTNNKHRQHPYGQLIDARVLGTAALHF